MLGFFLACESHQAETPVDVLETGLVFDMKEDAFFDPVGSLKSVEEFVSESESKWFRRDFYYDEDGKTLFSLEVRTADWDGFKKVTPGDTLGAIFYVYEQGKLSKELNCTVLNGQFTKVDSLVHTFDSMGRRFQEIDASGKIRVTYHYNDSNQVVFKKFGENQEREYCEYEYDELGKLSREIYWGAGDSPIMDYYFRYKGSGLLEAKETWALGTDGKGDVVKYFYNEQNQLVEALEFDSNFGFVQTLKKVYDYY